MSGFKNSSLHGSVNSTDKESFTSMNSLTKLDTQFDQIAFDSLDTKSRLTKRVNETSSQIFSQSSLFSQIPNTVSSDMIDLSESNKSSAFIEQDKIFALLKPSSIKSLKLSDEETESTICNDSKLELSSSISDNFHSYCSNKSFDNLEKSVNSFESTSNLFNATSDNQVSFEKITKSNTNLEYKKKLRKGPLFVSQLNSNGVAKFKEYERKKRKGTDTASNDTSYESGQIVLKEGSIKSSILDVTNNDKTDMKKRDKFSPKRTPNSTVIMMYRDDEDYVINSVYRESHK